MKQGVGRRQTNLSGLCKFDGRQKNTDNIAGDPTRDRALGSPRTKRRQPAMIAPQAWLLLHYGPAVFQGKLSSIPMKFRLRLNSSRRLSM